MEISIESIKALREKTGAGVMDSKRALQKSEGNIQAAEEILREEGIASASKKASRATNEGLVEAYIHSGGRIAALVELNLFLSSPFNPLTLSWNHRAERLTSCPIFPVRTTSDTLSNKLAIILLFIHLSGVNCFSVKI